MWVRAGAVVSAAVVAGALLVAPAAGAPTPSTSTARLATIVRGAVVRGSLRRSRGLDAGALSASRAIAAVPDKTVVIHDRIGDAADARGDLASAAAGIVNGSLAFAATVAQPSDPSIDANWSSPNTGILWAIETTNDNNPEFVAGLFGDGAGGLIAGIVNPKAQTLVCAGAGLYDVQSGAYAVGFASGCPATVFTFRWQALMVYDFDPPNQPSSDFAPDNGWAPSLTLHVHGHPSGYFMLGADGTLHSFGSAPHFASGHIDATALAVTHDGLGVWVVDGRGHVFTFGHAVYKGGSPALHAGERITAISATPSGHGYWLFSNRGGVYPYGDAPGLGNMLAVRLNGPVVASVATPTGHGYYMVGNDGGIFGFGDAKFHGSMGGRHLNRPIVGIAPTVDNRGYWLVGSDGGIFGFGDAKFRGSLGNEHLNRPINGVVAYGNGYLMVASDGGVFDFSNKPFSGSLGSQALAAPIVGVAAFAT